MAVPRYISRTSDELRRTIEKHGSVCPICRHVGEGIRRHIDSLFYELVNDIQTREAIRKSGGFCRPHSAMVAKQADALGTSLIYGDVLGNELKALDEGQFDRPPNTVGAVARILDGSVPGRAPCPICREERGQADVAIDALLEGMRHEDFAAAFERSVGLCLPHFRMAFLRARDTATWRRILDVERTSLTRLRAELKELSLKYDYRNAGEEVGDESDSWLRALFLAGGWPEDGK
jgi:transposase